jgi:predicted porin
LGVSGGFGSVVFSAAEGSDFLPVDGLTASSDGTDADRITYTTPKISGFTFSLSHQDAVDAGNAVVASISSVGQLAPPEINADARGTSSALTGAVNYSVGPISVDAVHADFSGSTVASRTGARAAYDFGMAKITYGMMKEQQVAAGGDVTETGLTIAAPLGPVTASYSYATSKTGTSETKKGNALSVSYALSKRSSLALYSEEHDHPGSAALTASKTKEYSLLLKHSF